MNEALSSIQMVKSKQLELFQFQALFQEQVIFFKIVGCEAGHNGT